jgi:hypothetical protein
VNDRSAAEGTQGEGTAAHHGADAGSRSRATAAAVAAPLPRFLIIGAQKSATRWLRLNLAEHPEVYAPTFEVSFFNHPTRYKRGADWYRAAFDGWAGEPIVGEATPGYMMWHHKPRAVARRIHRVVPDVRLFAILRNPVDRAYSAFIHHMRRGRIPQDADFLEHVRSIPPEKDRLGLITGGWYAASLRPYVRRFRDQLHVFLQDDAVDAPARLYGEALRHIGVGDGSFVPTELDEVRFSRKAPKTSRYADKKAGKRELSHEERAELFQWFERDVASLEKMIGRDLSAWRP